jgi:hypothetical protein
VRVSVRRLCGSAATHPQTFLPSPVRRSYACASSGTAVPHYRIISRNQPHNTNHRSIANIATKYSAAGAVQRRARSCVPRRIRVGQVGHSTLLCDCSYPLHTHTHAHAHAQTHIHTTHTTHTHATHTIPRTHAHTHRDERPPPTDIAVLSWSTASPIFTARNMQHCNAQHATHNVQHATYQVQHAAHASPSLAGRAAAVSADRGCATCDR